MRIWAIPLKQDGSGKTGYAEFRAGSKHCAVHQRGLEQTLLDFFAAGS